MQNISVQVTRSGKFPFSSMYALLESRITAIVNEGFECLLQVFKNWSDGDKSCEVTSELLDQILNLID